MGALFTPPYFPLKKLIIFLIPLMTIAPPIMAPIINIDPTPRIVNTLTIASFMIIQPPYKNIIYGT